MAVGSTKVVQVTNIAPQATKDQMQTLFGYLGKIEDIRLYPTIRDVAVPVQSRICYIKFHDQGCVAVAQHMTNTVFIDRALIVIPYQNGDIPDEQRALELTNNGTVVPGLYPSEPKLPPNVVNAIEGIPPNHVITTMDPKLEANGLPPYPHLPGHLDSRRIEEIRRTLVLANLDPSVTTDHLLDFFSNNNVEVKYLRMCTRDSDTEHYALVELSEQAAVVSALLLNGKMLMDRPIKIYHSTQAIAKPEAKSNEAAQKEIEEAMSRVKEAHNLISAAIDPMIGMLSKDKRSRSDVRVHVTDEDQDHDRNVLVPKTADESLRHAEEVVPVADIVLVHDLAVLDLVDPDPDQKIARKGLLVEGAVHDLEYAEKSRDKDKERRSKDKLDNGKKSDGDKADKEKSEKKSSKEKKSEKESKSEEKNRNTSENSETKEKTESET
ncbi:putative splicing factor, arginine/serine-rich 7 [Habropoda laboriosa]|uniref:Putative splicing factor, arginine/serine-rich 7 n=1 Tax=Habropoda laboriosa TaxID=597456 RepID=A0A0L7QSC5_9HYME|nr:putative splicing factor, arginine/serine-rich 7 [Habropoda laboriosa]